MTWLGLVADYAKRRWWYLLGLCAVPAVMLGPSWLRSAAQQSERALERSCLAEQERLKKALAEAAHCETDQDCTYLVCSPPDFCRYLVNSSVQQEPLQAALSQHFERCDAEPWFQACLSEGKPRCDCNRCLQPRRKCVND